MSWVGWGRDKKTGPASQSGLVLYFCHSIATRFKAHVSYALRTQQGQENSTEPKKSIVSMLLSFKSVTLYTSHDSVVFPFCLFADYEEFVFNSLFTLEMLLKIYGLGLRTYFRSSFNKFDVTVSRPYSRVAQHTAGGPRVESQAAGPP